MGQSESQSDGLESAAEMRRYWWYSAILPAIGVLIVSAVLSFTSFDLGISRAVWESQGSNWFARTVQPWHFFYEYGPIPGIVIGVAGLITCVILTLSRRQGTATRAAAFTAILLIVGPGLIINGGLKTWWGRPRPRQMNEFGGQHAFVPLGLPGNAGANSSFPSGHASMGFYLMVPGFLFLRRRRKLAFSLLGSGFLFGALVGTARIVQGGHFFSDVLWSGIIVYFTGLVLARLMNVDGLDLSDLRDLKLALSPKSLMRRPVKMSTPPTYDLPVIDATSSHSVPVRKAA